MPLRSRITENPKSVFKAVVSLTHTKPHLNYLRLQRLRSTRHLMLTVSRWKRHLTGGSGKKSILN